MFRHCCVVMRAINHNKMDEVTLSMTTEAGSARILNGSVDDFASSIVLFEKMEFALQQRLLQSPDQEVLLSQLAACKRQIGKLNEATELYTRLAELETNSHIHQYNRLALVGGLTNKSFDTVGSVNICPMYEWSEFLPEKVVADTLEYMCEHQGDFKPAEVGGENPEDSHYDPESRNNTELSLKGYPLKKTIRKLVSERLSTISQSLGLDVFESTMTEVKLRAYHHGEYFRVHQDGGHGRLISYVYFFHPEPQRYSGGDLVLFDTDTQNSTYKPSFTRIKPKNNSVFFFPSHYYHAVLPVETQDDDFLSSRFVINGHIWGEVNEA